MLDLVSFSSHDIVNNGTINSFVLAADTLPPVVGLYGAVVLALAHLLSIRQ